MPQNAVFYLDFFLKILFNPPEHSCSCQLGGIGRRARLKIEFERVWVRVPQLVLSNRQSEVTFILPIFFRNGMKRLISEMENAHINVCLTVCFVCSVFSSWLLQ